MKLAKGKLQLEDYIVEEISFKRGGQQKFNKKPEAPEDKLNLHFKVENHKVQKDRYRIRMRIIHNEGPLTNLPFNRFQLMIVLTGYFLFDKGLDEATKNKMIYNNGMSVLYGIARGIIAQLTGGLGVQRAILPTLNLLAHLKEPKRMTEAVRKA
ncbi:MAG TPA: hypothetical protein VFH55_04720 [Nitrospiria bacterium]|nr:hypothetical protein [Nitrospiria bacterium]